MNADDFAVSGLALRPEVFSSLITHMRTKTLLILTFALFGPGLAFAQDIERFKPAVSEVEPVPAPAKITLPPEDGWRAER